MKDCKCKDWEENKGFIDGALYHYTIHRFGRLKKYFNYCPYCGKKLEDEDEKGS